MHDVPMPYERLAFFQDQLGLNRDELEKLAPYSRVFTEKKDEFAAYFYNFFYEIPRTRIILQHERRLGFLKEMWAEWFASIFKTSLDEAFFAYLWKSGLRHVAVNLDQRYVNLGYCIVRQYCHGVICTEIPFASRGSVSLAITKMLDLCLLIETNAYMLATSHCDREMMKGISHQIRNPITVIGGNAKRMQKKFSHDNYIQKAGENILMESKRLERLVNDIGVYMELHQRESQYAIIPLEEIIHGAIKKLTERQSLDIRVQVDLDPAFPDVQGDPRDLETMFYYLLENSFEAVPPENPYVRITSKVTNYASHFIQVEIFNTGHPPKPKDLGNLFAPFYSSKPTGTGFGLPIAQAAAIRNLANLILAAIPGEGTKCIINLPLPG